MKNRVPHGMVEHRSKNHVLTKQMSINCVCIFDMGGVINKKNNTSFFSGMSEQVENVCIMF